MPVNARNVGLLARRKGITEKKMFGGLAFMLQWVEALGQGTIYSYVIAHEALRGWTGEVPYVVAIIELAEGPRMISNIVGTPIDRIKIGMPVTAFFEPAGEEISLPKFRAAKKRERA